MARTELPLHHIHRELLKKNSGLVKTNSQCISYLMKTEFPWPG